MPIDDPTAALQALNASDDRQRSPASKYAKHFLAAVKLLSPPGAKFALSAVEAAIEWVSRREEENRQELVDVLAAEMKYRGAQIELLLTESEEHRRFVAEEMPGLVLDGLRRAEQIRAKERIGRLGRILVHASEVGPRDGGDYAEEMMRIAMDLSDRDILVLEAIHRSFANRIGSRGRASRIDVLQTWGSGIASRLSLTIGEELGACLKLQSYGLIEGVEDRSKNNLADESLPFGLLQKGKDFVEYIQSRSGE